MTQQPTCQAVYSPPVATNWNFTQDVPWDQILPLLERFVITQELAQGVEYVPPNSEDWEEWFLISNDVYMAYFKDKDSIALSIRGTVVILMLEELSKIVSEVWPHDD